MTTPDQKEREQFYIKEFLSLLVDDSIRIKDKDRERPDFLLCADAKHLIGLELTEYHNRTPILGKKPRRALEADWDMLRKKINKSVSSDSAIRNLYGDLTFRIEYRG